MYNGPGIEATSYGFTGEYQDENGLLYLRARYYDASMGRFTQTDPSRLERNGYQYAGSSPGMYADPSGKCYGWASFMRHQFPAYCAQLDVTNEILSDPSQHTRAEVGGALNFAALSVAAAPAVVVAGATCIAGFEVCGPVLAGAGEFLAIYSGLYAAGVTTQYVASDLFGTEPPTPEELEAAQSIGAGYFMGYQIWAGGQNAAALDDWMTSRVDDGLDLNFSYGPGGPVGDSEELLQLMDYAETRRAYWVLQPGGTRPRYESVARIEIDGVIQYYAGQNGGQVAYEQLNNPL